MMQREVIEAEDLVIAVFVKLQSLLVNDDIEAEQTDHLAANIVRDRHGGVDGTRSSASYSTRRTLHRQQR